MSNRAPSRQGSATAAASLSDEAVLLVEQWIDQAKAVETRADRRGTDRLRRVVGEPKDVAFAMRFVDRVIRPESNRVAAEQFRSLVAAEGAPSFLGPIDRLLLKVGARLARVLSPVVMPLATSRMRQLVGHLVVDARPSALAKHLAARRSEGFGLNVNLLGEAVLGNDEAERRRASSTELLGESNVDYVSVKVSAVVSQLNEWAFDDSLDRVVETLRPMFRRAAATSPPTFVNLDMEEYHDLEMTLAAFTRLLDEPEFHSLNAGIVLQAYLPDSFPALKNLVQWATTRHRRVVDDQPGGTIKIRLVKGANLAMEKVEAAVRGWEQAPYRTKAETDANYKRCLDWVLTEERTEAVRIGLASHNLFDVAWGHLLSVQRGVASQLEFEMLQGMAPAQARIARDAGDGLLLYTPVVAPTDFDVAISYLFRRLEENSSDENFMRHLFDLVAGEAAFEAEASKFRAAVAEMHQVGEGPQRNQNRGAALVGAGHLSNSFENEPDTDPALAANRAWASEVLQREVEGPTAPLVDDPLVVNAAVAAAAGAQAEWAARPLSERREVLHAVADELTRRRGDLIAAMVREGGKTFGEADPEVSEAIDFARWYGDRCLELGSSEAAVFEPLGVVLVVPPWNFPVAIAAGGALAGLAAGNGVVLKPAPETPRCAEIVAECCWSAGVPGSLLQFLRTPDNSTGKHLITHSAVDAVVLTGGFETAELFRSWKPDLRILAETSGKNALIVTPNADLDLAVADLVQSAFGHSGQKCSAASLAILVGDVYHSKRFRRQLADAVRSLEVGAAQNLSTTMGPTITEPEGKLLRGLTQLDKGEEWLVEPRRIGPKTWSPGVRLGVDQGSWFHQTECFGPVLGLMQSPNLGHAIDLQNSNSFGLTGGIHSLDPAEVEHWLERVEVGNAYVNRPITGAIVQRQPFGGWKRSSVGPGAKAGGPNYLTQLGVWRATDQTVDDHDWLDWAEASDRMWFASEFKVEHDPSALFCEANIFRYRPLEAVAVRLEADGKQRDLDRIRLAAVRCGVDLKVSRFDKESAPEFAGRLASLGVQRLRILGPVAAEIRAAANEAEVHLSDSPVTSDGRIELLNYFREQSISRTLHRHGNLV